MMRFYECLWKEKIIFNRLYEHLLIEGKITGLFQSIKF